MLVSQYIKSACEWVIVTGLEIVQACFGIINIATITNWVYFSNCRLAFGIFYVTPRVIDIACNFCTRKVDYSDYIIKAVAIFDLNCITNKKQIQHNIYCFGTISVTYGWAYLWKIFVSVFHYEFTI